MRDKTGLRIPPTYQMMMMMMMLLLRERMSIASS
jgi:hypothetical protein